MLVLLICLMCLLIRTSVSYSITDLEAQLVSLLGHRERQFVTADAGITKLNTYSMLDT